MLKDLIRAVVDLISKLSAHQALQVECYFWCSIPPLGRELRPKHPEI